MQTIPQHLCDTIKNMACNRVHNKTPSRDGMIICLDVDSNVKIESKVENEIQGWVYNCLDSAHQALDFDESWDFVYNVRDDLFTDDIQNGIQFVLRFSIDHTGPYAWPLYDETDQSKSIHPSKVLEKFHTPPVFIRSVSISGVSQKLLREKWTDMISTNPNCFDTPGMGYMVLCEKYSGYSHVTI